MRKAVRIGLAALIAAGLFGAAPHALASGRSGGSRVSGTGACSAASTWTLTAKPDNGRLEVQFEVDSNVVGQTWNVRLSDPGSRGRLTATGRRSSAGIDGARANVEALARISPPLASDWRRWAMFTASPTTVYSSLPPPPTVPATTVPVLIPMPMPRSGSTSV